MYTGSAGRERARHSFPACVRAVVGIADDASRPLGPAQEAFFTGHFPGDPIVPGTVVIEAMAQVGAIFVMQSEPDLQGRLIYLAGLDRARFRKPVIPGDQVIFELELIKRKRDLWKVNGAARVDGRTAVEAVLLAVVAPDIEGEKE